MSSNGPINAAKGKRNKDNARALVKFAAEHNRIEIAYALQLSDDENLRRLGDILTDDAFRRHTLATLARQAGISAKRVTQCYFDSKVDEGKIRMAQHMPQMMEDIARDSLSTEKQCPQCDGTGYRVYKKPEKDADGNVVAPVPEACKECGGSGLVRVVGDQASRKLALEAAGLVGKGINVDARVQTINMPDGLEDTLALVKKVRDVQRDVTRATKPEVIEVEDATD